MAIEQRDVIEYLRRRHSTIFGRVLYITRERDKWAVSGKLLKVIREVERVANERELGEAGKGKNETKEFCPIHDPDPYPRSQRCTCPY